jgi:hypothetical protein
MPPKTFSPRRKKKLFKIKLTVLLLERQSFDTFRIAFVLLYSSY